MILDVISVVYTSDGLATIANTAQQIGAEGNFWGSVIGSIVDYAYKCSMVIIAVVNFIYVRKLNEKKSTEERNKEQEERAKERKAQKISYLKTLVYEENLPNLYAFFVNLENEIIRLKEKDVDKKEIEQKLQTVFKELRSKFIIVLSAAVPELGQKVQDIADKMLDQLVANMSDEGINLWVERYYNDMIKKVYEGGKVEIISTLFNYDGH